MNTVDYKAIGIRIKNTRIQNHLSQEQLAERCNISTSFLGHIERGTRKMSLETLVTLSTVLDVSIDYLLADRPVSGEKAIAPLLEEASQRLSEVQYQRLENAIKALIHSADLL
ncbi:MAG: helix-turn-helix transcriptional regulator [Firmicutes bacterium]|nr:helix-turn-helix transcriptional regulator [Bacillota bacterium]